MAVTPQRQGGTGATRGSAGSAQNYSKLVSTFGPTSTTVSDRAPLVAKDVLDKVALLTAIAVAAGTVTAIAKPAPGLMWLALFASFGAGLAGTFLPARAKFFAPLYAVTMGSVLGWISEFYANGRSTVVPLAVLGTTGIFFGVLVLYRTGLVRVTNRFVQVTLVATVGLLAMMIAVLFGLTIPFTSQGTTGLLVFGVFYLFIAIMNLFVDFNYVYMAQRAGVSKEGEWFSALSIMFSLVMVYLALLRILGGRR
jgi:uncharacterized YccA/Bax inhibitor family protein